MTNTISPPRAVWRRVTAAYAWVLSQLLVMSVIILIIPVSLQIFSRYTALIPSYIWTEEMARLLFIWTIMIGAMIGIYETRHFEVDVWPRLSPRPDAALRLFSRLAVLVIAIVFVKAGIEFTRFGWYRISELSELPLWLIHIAWPVAGVSWIVFLGEQMYDDVRILMNGGDAGSEPRSAETASSEEQAGGRS